MRQPYCDNVILECARRALHSADAQQHAQEPNYRKKCILLQKMQLNLKPEHWLRLRLSDKILLIETPRQTI